MHEIGLCEGIVATAARRAGDRPVESIRVRIGALHRVDQPSMEQAFSLVAAGTSLEGAAIELEIVPATFDCRTCGQGTEANELLMACPACGALDLEISGGDELLLESLRYRAAPAVERPVA